MGTRRERMEVALSGGRPWGFSVKGGLESNKLLVISKLEENGKAESGGLYVGDVVYSINNVPLSGMRSEAIALVRQSGHTLVLQIERGVRASAAGASYHHSAQRQTQYPRKPYYNPTQPQDQNYDDNYQRGRSCSDEYEKPGDKEDDVFQTDQAQSRQRSTTTSSISNVVSRITPPQDGARNKGETSYSARQGDQSFDYRPSRSAERLPQAASEAPSQPVVRLREKKARDKGIPIERPRSWHASKHPDIDLERGNLHEERRNMRSPGGAYPGSPASQPRYQQHHLLQSRRRSRGWTESGDLKSAYHGDVNGSKDSLISGGSHQSYRSNRLSVSSSRSSGMSSSRGSLDNLMDNGPAYRAGPDGHAQIFLSNGNRHKAASPSKPYSGIVNQNKHIFERLSHDTPAGGDGPRQYSKGSREDLEKISRVRRIPSDELDRSSSRSPPYQSAPSNNRPSFSPPPTVADKTGSLNRTHESSGDDQRYKYSSAKIVKTNLEGRRHDPALPDPPVRDNSSVRAVKNYHSRSHSGNSQEDPQRYSSSPDRVVSKLATNSPQNATAMKPAEESERHSQEDHSSLRGPLNKTSDKTEVASALSSRRQERVFGVMSVGNSTGVVATSVTVSPKPKDVNHDESGDSRAKSAVTSPPRYERLKDAYSHYAGSNPHDADYVTRKASEHQKAALSEPIVTAEHGNRSSGGSGDSGDQSDAGRGRGKSVVIWKTPQVHRKSKSSDFSSVLDTWASRDMTPAGGTASAIKSEGVKPRSFTGPVQPARNDENQPSIMRSLQSDHSLLTNKVATTNYEKLWTSSSRVAPQTQSGADVKSPQPASDAAPIANKLPAAKSPVKSPVKSGWEADFPSVDLDQPDDDDAFVGPDRKYIDNIKNMSRKVLRATSFTRRDLDVSPSIQSFDKKKSFFSTKLSQNQPHPAIIQHGRSRSHGNEIEEEVEPIAEQSENQLNVGSMAPSSGGPVKARPKSAGVTRPRPSRHVPVQRTTVAPSPFNSSPYYARKSGSLPRGIIPSYHSDESDQTSPIGKNRTSPAGASLAQNRRISIDVKPEKKTPNSDSNARQIVIDFMQSKARDSSGSLSHTYTSSTSIHTSHSDETDKRRKKEEKTPNDEGRITKLSSAGDLTSPAKSEHCTTPTSSRQHGHVASVRKLKNFSATRAVFDIDLRSPSSNEQRRGLRARASSLENLADEHVPAFKVEPPANNVEPDLDTSHELRDRSKSSPSAQTQSPPETTSGKKDFSVQAPPRRHHRQRLSNSSSASSTTTVSTLSSFSSASTASVERFPAVDEANERIAEERSSSPRPVADSTPQSTDLTAKEAEVEETKPEIKELPKRRIAFDTGTYRVVKGQKSHKKVRSARDGDQAQSSETRQQRSTLELRVNASKSPPAPRKTNVDVEAHSVPKSDESMFQKPPEPKPLPNEERVAAIIEKVTRSASFKSKAAHMSSKSLPAPPPRPSPFDPEVEKAMKKMPSQQKFSDLPLPPPPPPPPPQIPEKTATAPSALSPMSKEKLCTNTPTFAPPPKAATAAAAQVPSGEREGLRTPTTDDTYKEVTYLLGSSSDSDTESKQTSKADSKSRDAAYENVHASGANRSYENVFKPIQSGQNPTKLEVERTVPAVAVQPSAGENKENIDQRVRKETTFPAHPSEEEVTVSEKKKTPSPPPEISPMPLLPDLSLLPASSLQQEHPDLTRDIIRGDQALAPMLTASSKKTLHYMTDVMEQSSHDIVHQRMRSSVRIQPSTYSSPSSQMTANGRPVPCGQLLVIDSDVYMQKFRNDISHENLPASSTYYKTSASKAKILNMVKEKIAGGEIVPGDECEDINSKKMELVLSIKKKLDDLHSLQKFLDDEIRDNELLGKQVLDLTKQFSTPREQDKYNSFVQDVDRIINLLLSLSGRLARVENTIQMLPADADKQEMELLLEKKNKLIEQHTEAKLLKENIDRRQKAVSETLAGYLNQAQFADYEHHIKMKSALIMEQRELNDKIKLGEEQMQCLRDSLPDDWQCKLDKMLEIDA